MLLLLCTIYIQYGTVTSTLQHNTQIIRQTRVGIKTEFCMYHLSMYNLYQWDIKDIIQLFTTFWIKIRSHFLYLISLYIFGNIWSKFSSPSFQSYCSRRSYAYFATRMIRQTYRRLDYGYFYNTTNKYGSVPYWPQTLLMNYCLSTSFSLLNCLLVLLKLLLLPLFIFVLILTLKLIFSWNVV